MGELRCHPTPVRREFLLATRMGTTILDLQRARTNDYLLDRSFAHCLTPGRAASCPARSWDLVAADPPRCAEACTRAFAGLVPLLRLQERSQQGPKQLPVIRHPQMEKLFDDYPAAEGGRLGE